MIRQLVLTLDGVELARHPVTGPAMLLGRGPDCDVQVRDISLSRRHFRLRQQSDQWIVEDLGSRNGTFLNDAPVMVPVPVKSGDWLRAGRLTIRLDDTPLITPQSSSPSRDRPLEPNHPIGHPPTSSAQPLVIASSLAVPKPRPISASASGSGDESAMSSRWDSLILDKPDIARAGRPSPIVRVAKAPDAHSLPSDISSSMDTIDVSAEEEAHSKASASPHFPHRSSASPNPSASGHSWLAKLFSWMRK